MAGESSVSIAQRLGIHQATVPTILKRNGIAARKAAPPRAMSAASEQKACEMYVAGENTTAIATKVGVGDETIRRVLRRHGITLRSWGEAHRKYDCDHSFFDRIDTEAKAYWMGFIAADGCIHHTQKGGKVLTVCLGVQDTDHLHRFKTTLQSTHPIGFSKRGECSIAISSDRIATALAEHSITPRKTFTVQWPEHLPPNLLRHYLRGYFDGDGCFSVKRKGSRRPSVHFTLTSNRPFCEAAQRYLMSNARLNETKLGQHHESPGVASVCYGGNKQVARIYRLMYEGAAIWLPRKRDTARSHLRDHLP